MQITNVVGTMSQLKSWPSKTIDENLGSSCMEDVTTIVIGCHIMSFVTNFFVTCPK